MIPVEPSDMCKLKCRLILQRIPFNKSNNSKSTKLHIRGTLVNVQTDPFNSSALLPRTMSDYESVAVILKRHNMNTMLDM